MDILRILLSAVTGTFLMTAFSYAMSAAFRKLYEEPVLLDSVFRRLGLPARPTYRRAWAWMTHFLAGCVFAVAFEWYWLRDGLTITTTLIGGAVAGIAGILVWMVTVRIPDTKPPVVPSYYLQLFIAHLIFAFGAAGASWWYGFPHNPLNT